MICGGAAHCSIARRFARPDRWPVALLLLISSAHIRVASAADSVDCASINAGHLDVALASDSNALRKAEMQEGDTLAFTFHADARATGTITLVTGDGSEQRLLYGPHATQVSYTADRPSAVAFRLATKGGKIATFVTTCTPALAQGGNPARGSGATALDGLNIDMGVPLSFGATASKDNAATTVANPAAADVQWLGGQQAGTAEAAAGTYGVNLKLQPAIMVGVLAQFDQSGDTLLGPSALSDQAWLAGPVTNVQFGGGLSLDARAAWGPVDPGLGHAVDRQTLDARLVSKQVAGPWRFSPSIGLSRVQERFGATAVEPAANIPGHQTIESGRFDVKPEMAYRVDMDHSMFIEPRLMVGAFWNIGDVGAPGTVTGAQHEARHIAETGITVGTGDGTKLQLGGGVQEGETRSDNVWSGKMQLNIPLK